MLEPSSSEESDVDGDEAGYGATGGGLDAARAGRPIPVLGGRVAGFATVGAFGFGQSGLAGALNSSVSTSLSSNTSLVPSSTYSIAPPNIDLLQQRSHSLSTGIKLLSAVRHDCDTRRLQHSTSNQKINMLILCRSLLIASCCKGEGKCIYIAHFL